MVPSLSPLGGSEVTSRSLSRPSARALRMSVRGQLVHHQRTFVIFVVVVVTATAAVVVVVVVVVFAAAAAAQTLGAARARRGLWSGSTSRGG